MKIVAQVEKAGQVLAQSEFDAGTTKDPMKKIGKAIKVLRKEHPNLSLFDQGVCLKFIKAE
jgi:hypothetical protein